MSTQTIFGSTDSYSRSRTWGQLWTAITYRARELTSLLTADRANDFVHGAINCNLLDTLAENVARWQANPDLQQSDWLPERVQGLSDGRAIFAHLQATNFDGRQLQHIAQFLDQAAALTVDYRVFFVQSELSKLENDERKTPWLYINAELMRKCTTDLRIAERALFQRLRQGFGGATALTWQGYFLALADLMAYVAIQPLKEAGLIPANTAVITYMQEETEIRLLPYYPILFIGIPSAVTNSWGGPPSSFLAIPHEIGHYLYRFATIQTPGSKDRGRIAHVVLEERLTDLNILSNDWRRHWLEELFADAFGCLLAGPISVLAFQEYLADNEPATLSKSSAKHPIAALRPLIQSAMIRELTRRGKADCHPLPDLLDQHWQNYLRSCGSEELRADVTTATFTPQGQQPPLTGAAVIDGLQVIFQEIFTLLDELFPNQDWQAWSGDLPLAGNGLVATMQALQGSLVHFYCQEGKFRLATIVPPAIDATQEPSVLRRNIQKVRSNIEDDLITKMPFSEWQTIFNVPGWSDEGGEAGHID